MNHRSNSLEIFDFQAHYVYLAAVSGQIFEILVSGMSTKALIVAILLELVQELPNY